MAMDPNVHQYLDQLSEQKSWGRVTIEMVDGEATRVINELSYKREELQKALKPAPHKVIVMKEKGKNA